MRIEKFSRPGVILMATVVVVITSMVAANATQSITAPNAAFISYSLAAGANSAAITPVTNKSVLVMGCNTSTNPAGGGQVSLLHLPSAGISWAGLESGTGSTTTTTTAGFASAAGTHIVYIDGHHLVDIQVASADTIRVHNSNSTTQVGSVTLIW
jgi:hypothetical protein